MFYNKTVWEIRLLGLLTTLFLFNNYAKGQINLIPNPSFEVYDTCPYWDFNPPYSGVDAICKAVPWFQPSSPDPGNCGGSTDFFHTCAGSVPQNINGFQYARTGLGYAGAWMIFNPEGGGEYLQIPLIANLKKKNYCISFYVVRDDIMFSSTNCIQARFTKDSVLQPNFDRIILTDGINATEILRDTLNWMLVKGIYSAKGVEKFMTVGCFDLLTSDDFQCSETGVCGPAAYYFDDFGVYELPEISAGIGGEIDTLGENVQLQATCEGCWNDLVYRWWPSAGLSDTTILNPIATPEITTTYYFGLIDTSETVPCIVDLVDSVTVFVTIPEDTITPPNTFSWLVYPSPTNGNLTVQFSGLSSDSQLLVIDARGRLVRKISVPKNTQSLPLDISVLASGEYFLQLENSGLKQRRKIVKF